MKKIILEFDQVVLEGELFDTAVASAFYDALPVEISLIHWGTEMYGAIGKDLGEENPIPIIPRGGLAYTNKGNYFCVFYGQNPAWPVEHLGRLSAGWQGKLSSEFRTLTVKKK